MYISLHSCSTIHCIAWRVLPWVVLRGKGQWPLASLTQSEVCPQTTFLLSIVGHLGVVIRCFYFENWIFEHMTDERFRVTSHYVF